MSDLKPTAFPFQGVPGRVDVEVAAFIDGDPRFQARDVNGQFIGNQGVPLRRVRERFGGHEGDLTDSLVGLTHHISVVPWADADPDKTFVRIRFQFIPQS